MIFSDEYLDRLAQGWTPAEVRELIRQHKLALQTLDALAVFVPPRRKEEDVRAIADVIGEHLALGVSPKKIARLALEALALPNAEVHVAIGHFREQVISGDQP